MLAGGKKGQIFARVELCRKIQELEQLEQSGDCQCLCEGELELDKKVQEQLEPTSPDVHS